MSKQVEHILQNAVIQYALSKRFLVIRINSGTVKTDKSYVRFYTICNTGESAGLSDLILMKDGLCYFLEIKKPGGKQTEKQKKFEQTAELYDMPYFLISNIDTAIELINNLF